MKKIILLIVGLLLVGFLSWRVIATVKVEVKPKTAQGKPPVSVDVADVREAPIQEKQQFTGAVFPGYRYVVAPRVSGRVLTIGKRVGDQVGEGEVVARIEDAEYRQAVAEADANLRIARAGLSETKVQRELAAQELERMRAMETRGIASRSELDKAQAEYDALETRLALAQAQIEQREAALSSAQIRLGYTVLTASRPGHVGERFVDEGAMLAANTPVMAVVGIDPAIVRATVIERLYGRITPGQKAAVEADAYPAQSFPGTVVRIAPVLMEDSRVAEMEIEVGNGDLRLKPGMFARVTIVLSEKASARLVPIGALTNRNGQSGVFVLSDDGKMTRWQPVQVGLTTTESAEILSPKLSGKVVTLGQHLLEDGSPVIVAKPAKKGGA